MFNIDISTTLRFISVNEVKYADILSAGDPMTIMLRIWVERKATIQPLIIILKNPSRSYPVYRVTNTVPGSCYRTYPKGWME